MRRLAMILASGLLLSSCSSAASPQARADALDDDLPERWSAEVVEDERVGSFVLSRPEGAVIWLVGERTDELAAATGGTSWAGFWLSLLRGASSSTSNVRAVVADTSAVSGDVVSWQVNVNDLDPAVSVEDPDELAEVVRDRFEDQGLEITDHGTASSQDRVAATVAFLVPAEAFGGEERHVRQWYVPQADGEAMWSLSCDAPADPTGTEELCRTGFDGFLIAEPVD